MSLLVVPLKRPKVRINIIRSEKQGQTLISTVSIVLLTDNLLVSC